MIIIWKYIAGWPRKIQASSEVMLCTVPATSAENTHFPAAFAHVDIDSDSFTLPMSKIHL